MMTLFVFPGLCMAIYQENKLSDIVTYATLSITVMGFYSYEPRERSSDYCETQSYIGNHRGQTHLYTPLLRQ
jgi:hypothetical protein